MKKIIAIVVCSVLLLPVVALAATDPFSVQGGVEQQSPDPKIPAQSTFTFPGVELPSPGTKIPAHDNCAAKEQPCVCSNTQLPGVCGLGHHYGSISLYCHCN